MAKNTKASKTEYIWTSGRRKTAVARIRMQKGKGSFVVNDKEQSEFFDDPLDRENIAAPFKETGQEISGFDISVKTHGGGLKAQVEATRLGLAKALSMYDENLRKILRKKGLLTRDPRMKERKKIGLHKARRAHQFSKR